MKQTPHSTFSILVFISFLFPIAIMTYQFGLPNNKGLAYNETERDRLHISSLFPTAIRSQLEQIRSVLSYLDQRCHDDLARYIHLRSIQDQNEDLFFAVLQSNTSHVMPLVYTPTVGQACLAYSQIYEMLKPRGLWISIARDLGRVREAVDNWRGEVKVIVVTDGERILGLGDLGANGMGISVGKSALYTAIGGIPPHLVLPVTLDVGTNNPTLLSDPLYIGLREKRTTSQAYDQLVDEFMKSVTDKWGKNILVQFEDFGNHNAFRLLDKYNSTYTMFNDDIQGTASVTVAGILASLRITSIALTQNRFLFLGAGEAALGIGHLLVTALQASGLDEQSARDRIFLVDSQGLVTRNRTRKDPRKDYFAKDAPNLKNLVEIVNHVKPSCLIGAAAQPGAFTKEVIRRMAMINPRPVIFALSNPTSKSECTAEEAYRHSTGRAIFASGSPFPPVTLGNQTFHPGQGNNAYIFPAIGLAVAACHVSRVPEHVFLIAAQALADQVTKFDLDRGAVYPPVAQLREVSLKIASKVTEWFYESQLAQRGPEPKDKLAFLRDHLYDPFYGEEGYEQRVETMRKAWQFD